jgi:hypothetical protein
MADWVDLHEEWPDLRGTFLHAWPEAELGALRARLEARGFRTLVVDTREGSFLDGLAAGLRRERSPGLDAANDLLLDWAGLDRSPRAVVWSGADALAARDAQAFLDALWLLEALVPSDYGEPQCEVFVAGAGAAYLRRST